MTKLPSDRGDPFEPLRRFTPARIGLGRVGAGLPTAPWLDFQSAHAQAQAAVWEELDVERLRREAEGELIGVSSAAPDRQSYLRRPDLGRRIGAAAPPLARGPYDLAVVLADGLSAAATQKYGLRLASALLRRIPAWKAAPLVVATQARVALGDEIGARLGAGAVVMLLGERPGLSAPESLGAYITWAPRPGRLDAERNCVSNIREGGISCENAAEKIAWILTEALRMGFTGVALKDRQPTAHAVADADPAPRPLEPPTAGPPE